MPKFTPEMEERIIQTYMQYPTYARAAKELVLDEKAVRNVIVRNRGVNSSLGNAKSASKEVVEIQNETDLTPSIREELKTMYREFLAGKKPPEIIAMHGLDPELVDKEYTRFSRQRGCDIRDLQKRIFSHLHAADHKEFAKYVRSFEENGFLTNNKMMNFLKEWVAMMVPQDSVRDS